MSRRRRYIGFFSLTGAPSAVIASSGFDGKHRPATRRENGSQMKAAVRICGRFHILGDGPHPQIQNQRSQHIETGAQHDREREESFSDDVIHAYRLPNCVQVIPEFADRRAGGFRVGHTVLFALIFKLMQRLAGMGRRSHRCDIHFGHVHGRQTAVGIVSGGAGFTDIYGAAGSFVILLVSVYYSAQVLLFGDLDIDVTRQFKDEGSGN